MGWVKIGAGGDFKWLQVISNDLMTYINHNVMSCVGLENMHYTFYFYFFYKKKKKKAKKKERLQKKAHERYHNFSEEERNKKHQYGCERYRNLPEDQKKVREKVISECKNLIKTSRFFY